MTPTKLIYRIFLLFLILSTTACSTQQQTASTKKEPPFYTNLFVQNGISASDVQQRLDTTFQQLFHGDAKDQTVYFSAGKNTHGNLAYIMDINSDDVRSEGMSYGMMITLQLDKKAEFDALWNWARTYMYHTDENHPAKGYFSWSMKTDGTPLDEMPAPDGEEYFITALYFASTRWGDGEGIYAYKKEADRILSDMRHRKSITGPTVKGIKSAGNMFDENTKSVRFTPDFSHANQTDASYHLPGFYEVWARMGPENDREFWRQAAQASRDYFIKAANPATALTPDYGNFDGTPWGPTWRKEAVDFRYDAWRTAMNWSMDWVWWQKDPRQIQLSNHLQSFFLKQGLTRYQSLYTLDGKLLGGGQTTGLVAMNAIASTASNHPQKLEFVNALWEKPIPTGKYRYYDGMLYMFGLLHTSGQFRLWMPDNRN
jgi:oligosaccharide reducing-end xylanase